MSYDDWKITEPPDPYDPPPWCEECGHPLDYCDCRCCTEPDEKEA
jgi:hypothetical protein